MQGKVALITGAAKGLGRAFGEALMTHGTKVCICDVDLDVGTQTYKALRSRFGTRNVMFKQCDVVSNEDMNAVFMHTVNEFGCIDVVVNNAGISHEKNWEKMLNINLLGAIRGTYLALKYMGKDKGGNGGTVINIASVAGLKSTQFVPGYSASKAGLISFSKSLAENKIYYKHGVRINCLCPFFAETDIIKFNEDTVIGTKTARKALEVSGVMPVTTVVDSFLELVQSTDLNGEVLLVSAKGKKLVAQQFNTFDSIMEGAEF